MSADPGWDTWSAPAREEGTRRESAGETVNPAALSGLAAIGLYQLLISPALGNNCQFLPSCSRYALRAIAARGLVNGAIMGAERVSRCHPFAILYGYPASPEGFLTDPPEANPAPVPPLSWLGL